MVDAVTAITNSIWKNCQQHAVIKLLAVVILPIVHKMPLCLPDNLHLKFLRSMDSLTVTTIADQQLSSGTSNAGHDSRKTGKLCLLWRASLQSVKACRLPQLNSQVAEAKRTRSTRYEYE